MGKQSVQMSYRVLLGQVGNGLLKCCVVSPVNSCLKKGAVIHGKPPIVDQ